MKRAKEFGIRIEGTPDFAAVQARKGRIVNRLSKGSAATCSRRTDRAQSAMAAWKDPAASVKGESGETRLRRETILATGSKPKSLPARWTRHPDLDEILSSCRSRPAWWCWAQVRWVSNCVDLLPLRHQRHGGRAAAARAAARRRGDPPKPVAAKYMTIHTTRTEAALDARRRGGGLAWPARDPHGGG
jgi:hypothetical protein